MFSDTSGWLLLLVDVSLKATLLAMLAAAGLALFRVTNLHVRHRVWTAVLLGMLAMPLVVNVVPGLSIPVPGLARISDVLTPTAEVESAKMPPESNTPAISGEPIARPGVITPGMETPIRPSAEQPMFSPASEISFRSLAIRNTDADALAEVKTELADNEAVSVPWRVIVSTFITGLVATYAGIALILITRLFLGVLRATFLIRASSPITESSSLALAVRDGVLCESKLIRVPITVGMLRPCVLLPLGWRDWSQDKLDVVLRHELTHIARRDYAVNLIAEFNRCLYWFHPLAWCLIRWLSDLAERNCDDAVIASTGDRTSYARHLLEIAATVVEPTRVAIQPGISMARSADVESRIDAILDMDRPLSKRMGWKSTALLVAAMLPTFWLAAALRAQTPQVPDVEAQVETENNNVPAKEETTSSVSKVSGRVVDDQGQSVANATISLVLYSHEPDRDRKLAPATNVWDTAQSDAEGDFSLEYPPVSDPEYYTKRAYRLVAIAQKKGLGLGWKYIEFSDKETATEIKLPQEQVRRGRLVGLEGQPIAGAMVHVVGVGTPAPKWLEFRKWPFHDGMPLDEPVDTTIPVDENDHLWPNLIRFRLPPFAVNSWPKSVTSDENGVFEIRGVAAQQLVEFHIYGTDQAGSAEHSLGAGDGLVEPIAFALDEPRMITGVVTDKLTGKPIVGAKVRVDSAGAIMILARMPVVADWKGRQGHLGNLHALQWDRTVFLMPAAFTTTDNEGRYQVSAFRNQNGFQNDRPFAITVSSPDDASYLPSKKTIPWPKKTVFKQEADLQLTPGVRVTARIISADGQPAPRARADFWSRELLYPYEQIESSNGIPRLSPDGVQHPHWRKADGEGRFEMIVPRGESYLFVNQESSQTAVDRVDAIQVGLPDREVLIPSPVSFVLPPRTSVEPHRFYPDRAVSLSYAADKESDELTIQLHQKAPTLTVEVVLPDGTPANDLIYMGGQAPFRYYALKLNRLMQKIGDNKFSIACCDAQSPVSVAFLARGSGLGLHTEIAAQDIGDKVMTLTLQPLGQARARFIDKDNKPLNAFRPLMWMSLPRKPFSTAADLEQQTVSADSSFLPLQQSFDSIWTSLLHKHTHASLKTDAEGNAVFKALIPGATYRLSQFGGQTKDFVVQPGEAIDLGDVMVFEPERTKSLPQAEPQPNEEANAAAEREAGEAVVAKKNEPIGISGRVVGPDGKPIAGAKIAARLTANFLAPQLVTDENGRFVMTGDKSTFDQAVADNPRVEAIVFATKDGLAADWRMLLMQELPGNDLQFRLQQEMTIQGQLVSSEGTPLSGVEVTAKEISKGKGGLDELIRTLQDRGSNRIQYDDVTDRFRGQQKSTTDAQGRFQLAGVSAERVVELWLNGQGVPGLPLIVLTRTAPENKSDPAAKLPADVYYSEFVHVVPATRTLIGIVRDQKTREPLPDVDLYCHAAGDRKKSGADGRFEFKRVVKSASYSIEATADGRPYFANHTTVGDAKGLEPIEVLVEMQRGITVRGRVTDSDGPVKGSVEYEVLYPNPFADRLGDRVPWPCSQTQIQTDGSYEIQVHPGPGVLAVRADQNDKAANYVTPKIDLDALETILGETNDQMHNQQHLSVHRGGRGMGGFIVRSYQAIEFINPDEKAEELTHDLLARPGAKFRGRVLDADGESLVGVEMDGLKPRFMGLDHIIGSDFTALAMEAGVARKLTLFHEAKGLGTVVTVNGTEQQPYDVKLQPCGTVTGRLLGKNGSPLTNAQIVLNRGNYIGPRRWFARTDEKGSFSIKGLIPGETYNGRVEAHSDYNIISSLVVNAGEVKDVGMLRLQ